MALTRGRKEQEKCLDPIQMVVLENVPHAVEKVYVLLVKVRVQELYRMAKSTPSIPSEGDLMTQQGRLSP